VDLSLSGCRIGVGQRILADTLGRIEMQFQLRGIAFRIMGIAVGSRGATSFGVRFLDMPARRRIELAEVIAEVAARSLRLAGEPEAVSERPAAELAVSTPVVLAVPPERRAHSRYAVDATAKLMLVRGGISMPGRIQNLSLGGCRFRAEERVDLGIYVRVEAEFCLLGKPLRLAGVSQSILDKNTVGIRFLDLSERRRESLIELLAEVVEREFNATTQVDQEIGDMPQA
jgi:hypothetical protein